MATGSRYWADSSILGFDSTLKKLFKGGSVKIHNFEAEDNEPKYHNLTLAKIERGLEVMADKEASHFADIVSGNEDEITSDVLLQCSLFGETVYG